MINLFLVQNCCTETVLTCPCYVTRMETFSPPNFNYFTYCNRQFQTASTKGKEVTSAHPFLFLKTAFNTRNFLPILCTVLLALMKVLGRSLASPFALLTSLQHLILSARGRFPQCCFASHPGHPSLQLLSFPTRVMLANHSECKAPHFPRAIPGTGSRDDLALDEPLLLCQQP